MAEPRRCVELDGRCPANPLREADPDGAFRCPMHSTAPAVAVRRAEWHRRGGQSTRKTLPADRPKADLASTRGIRRELRDIIHAVLTGSLAPEIGKVAMLGLSVGVKLAELEVHGVISDLEQKYLAQLNGQTPRRLTG